MEEKMYYLNENVKNLNRIFDQNSRDGYLRLDLNENPSGLPEPFIKKVLEGIDPEFIAKYPETMEFTQILADFIGASPENICLTNGSAEGIRYLIEAFTGPGGKILGVTPTYAMYEVYANMYGREYVAAEYDPDLTMPVERVLGKMTGDIQLLILLNPNNPVGNTYTAEEMDMLIRRAKEKEITVLIDEAYFYFYPVSFINYALENDHVFLTRTFSKLFSLAGTRLGYVIGRKEGIEMIQKLCTPHNVNAFGIRFAREIIKTEGMIDYLTKTALDGKAYLIEELTKRGYTTSGGEGNFVFIKPNNNADYITKKLKEQKILVKTYKNIGRLGDCLRVTIGDRKVMEVFLDAFLNTDMKA